MLLQDAITVLQLLATGKIDLDSTDRQNELREVASAVVLHFDRLKNSSGSVGHLLNAGKPWDKLQHEKLVYDFENGLSNKEIASEMGRTEGAIRSRLEKFGLVDVTPKGVGTPSMNHTQEYDPSDPTTW